eukprot:m.485892 g.485892  ORF g.485892 m.485892 type:complete len:864 (+) comp24056_c0_seq1:290-2881(+)
MVKQVVEMSALDPGSAAASEDLQSGHHKQYSHAPPPTPEWFEQDGSGHDDDDDEDSNGFYQVPGDADDVFFDPSRLPDQHRQQADPAPSSSHRSQPLSLSSSTETRAAQLIKFLHEVSTIPGCNVSLPVPKVVFMGHQSSGKSSMLDSLLGVPLSVVGDGTATRCPIEYFVMYDESAKEPLWSATTPGAEKVSNLSTEAAARLLRRHNDSLPGFDSRPVRLEMRWQGTGNFVFVDLPGLQNNPERPDDAEAIHRINCEALLRMLEEDSDTTINVVLVEETSAQQAAFDPSKLLSLPHVARVLADPVLRPHLGNAAEPTPATRTTYDAGTAGPGTEDAASATAHALSSSAATGTRSSAGRVRVVLAQTKCDLLAMSGSDFCAGLAAYLKAKRESGVVGFPVEAVFLIAGLGLSRRRKAVEQGLGGFQDALVAVEQETARAIMRAGSPLSTLDFGIAAVKQWTSSQIVAALHNGPQLLRIVTDEIKKKNLELTSLREQGVHAWAVRDLWPYCASVQDAFASIWTVKEGSSQGTQEEQACSRLMVQRVVSLADEYATLRQGCTEFTYRELVDEIEDQLPSIIQSYNSKIWGSGQIRRAIQEFVLSLTLTAGRDRVVDRARLAAFVSSAKASLPTHAGADEYKSWNSIASQAMSLFQNSPELDQDILAVNDAIRSICRSWVSDAFRIADAVRGPPVVAMVEQELKGAVTEVIDGLCERMEDECRRIFSQTALFSGHLPEPPLECDSLEVRLERARGLTDEHAAMMLKPEEVPEGATVEMMIPFVEQACTRRYLRNLQLSCSLVTVVHRQAFQDCLVAEVKGRCSDVCRDLAIRLTDEQGREAHASQLASQVKHLQDSVTRLRHLFQK